MKLIHLLEHHYIKILHSYILYVYTNIKSIMKPIHLVEHHYINPLVVNIWISFLNQNIYIYIYEIGSSYTFFKLLNLSRSND